MPGSARHPTAIPASGRPHGRVIPGNTRVTTVQYAVPDPLAVQLADAMAIATAPVSPMAIGGDGGSFRPGLPGVGINRFAGRLAQAVQVFTTPIRPIQVPKSVRVGMQAGPSSPAAYPSTGADTGFGSLAMMSSKAFGAQGMVS